MTFTTVLALTLLAAFLIIEKSKEDNDNNNTLC